MSNSGEEKAAELKPCSMCGLPTKSKYAMCQRPGPCGKEYRRLWAGDQDKEHRNEIARRYRRNQKVAPCVYGIFFPGPAVLKVNIQAGYSAERVPGTEHRRSGTCIAKRP